MGAKDLCRVQSDASPGLCTEAKRPFCFLLYPLGAQAGLSAWQMLHVSTVSRKPSDTRIKVSLLPSVVRGMALPCASESCEPGRC